MNGVNPNGLLCASTYSLPIPRLQTGFSVTFGCKCVRTATIQIGETKLAIHKACLAGLSPYFAEILNATNTVTILDFDVATTRNAIAFYFNSDVLKQGDMTDDMKYNMIRFACRYKFDMKRISKYISKLVTVGNVLKLAGNMWNDRHVRKAILPILSRNPSLLNSTDFTAINVKIRKQLVYAILHYLSETNKIADLLVLEGIFWGVMAGASMSILYFLMSK